MVALSGVGGLVCVDRVKAGRRRMENLSCSQARLSSAKLIFLWTISTAAEPYRDLGTWFRFCRKTSPADPSLGGLETWSFRGAGLPRESKQRTKSTLARRTSRGDCLGCKTPLGTTWCRSMARGYTEALHPGGMALHLTRVRRCIATGYQGTVLRTS